MKQYLFSLICITSIAVACASEQADSDAADVVNLDTEDIDLATTLDQFHDLTITHDANRSDIFICNDTAPEALACIDVHVRNQLPRIRAESSRSLTQNRENRFNFDPITLEAELTFLDNINKLLALKTTRATSNCKEIAPHSFPDSDATQSALSHTDRQESKYAATASKKLKQIKRPYGQKRNITNNSTIK